ncbi:MAG TPA: adenylate/guanylate cyclase domain-containing protein [Stellaceae bacterium]|nr:adenylate/guanylate cyclase domain-containing protein [Stellaceae bacterium]
MPIDITIWLRGLGLEQYASAFHDNDIDGTILADLTADDLRSLGVTSIGHRRKLLVALAALRKLGPVTENAPAEIRKDKPAPVPATELPMVERRQLTIMFCDLVGSTELATTLDPEDLRDIIATYHHCVSELLTRYGGFAARLMGDGVLAYFGYPLAHEDDPERAVRAALAMVKAVGDLRAAQPLQVRIGIATGLVVVGDLMGSGAAQEQTVVGETPNLAARLQVAALPDTVVVSDTTRRQLGSLFEIEDLGPQNLKGFVDRPRAWRIVAESGVVSRFVALRSPDTPLIGRDEELDLLLRRWKQAKMSEGRAVLLSAEAGIGKSRLTEALIEQIASENPTRLRYFCSPHHQDSALFPIVDQLERAAQFTHDDAPSTRLEKLARLLFADAEVQENDLALFADLLSLVPSSGLLEGLPPQRKKELTFEAMLRQLEALSRQNPVLIVFEDLHWVDPSTRELIDRIIALIEHLPILLIATFRPEFQAPWVGQPHVMILALARLGRRHGTALVKQLLARVAVLPPETIAEIIERTDGVPLFLEEVTKVVLEAAIPTGAVGTVTSLPGRRLTVPPTLQASLMARLDGLGTVAREIAQAGAAIGRDFSYDLLRVATQRSEAETRAALDRLVAAGLMFQRGLPPAAEYQFKHSLVQDTAYATLLRGPRQALHRRIAAAMQERFPEIVERSPETLGHHMTEAGDFDGAAGYWLEAGRRASGQSANVEAAAHLMRGVAALAGLDETLERMRLELALQLALGPVLLSTRGYAAPEARRPYQRAADLAARLGLDASRFAASWGLWITTRGDGAEDEERLRHLGEMVEIAERVANPELSLQAHHSAWATWIWGGEFVRSQDHFREGIALYDPDKHRHHALMYGGHDPGVCGLGQNAVALWALGYPDQAAQSAGDGITLAERLAHVPSLLHALWFAAAVSHLRRDLATTRKHSERLMSLGSEHHFRQHKAIGGIFRGWVLTQTGSTQDGLVELRSSVDFYSGSAWTMLGLFRALVAEAELLAGNYEQAEAALGKIKPAGNRWWWSECLRLRGELQQIAITGDLAGAECSYRQAIAVARELQAKSLELRVANSLARLWRDAGKRAEAHALLAPLTDWFTEGFDMPDLVEAKALLHSVA